MSASEEQSGGILVPLKRPRPVSPSVAEPSSEVIIYVSVLFPLGPISQCIYALTLPDAAAAATKVSYPHPHRERGESNLYPILEISKGQYAAVAMRCVKLESRFYFLGGIGLNGEDLFTNHPPNVYFADIETLSHASASPDSLILKDGIPMACGKPNCYAFEAHGKIYAVASHHPLQRYNNDRFEVFEGGKWSTLPIPPFRTRVTSQSCVDDNTIILCTKHDGVFFFDIKLSKWTNVDSQTTFSPIGPTLLVQGSFFYNYNGAIASCGPILGELTDAILYELTLPENQSIASAEVSKHILLPYHSHLLYLGDKKFCYLMDGNFPDPNSPHDEFSGDPDRGDLRVIVFEVTGEKFHEHDGQVLVFGTKLLQTTRYIRRSKQGANASGSSIDRCFLICPQQVEVEVED